MTEIVFSILEISTAIFFGTYLSCAFAGVQYTKKNVALLSGFSVFCLCIIYLFNARPNQLAGWMILPLLIHVPNLLFLTCFFHKRFSTTIAAICTSFLLCQPPKWIFSSIKPFLEPYGILKAVVFLTLFLLSFLFGYYVSQPISKLYSKDTKSVYIFGSIPFLYYVSNYFLEIYTNFWSSSNPMITEFFRFSICIIFIIFSVVYCKEYEQKADLERQEQIIRISFEQQKKEMETIRKKEREVRIIRHDMRLFLNTLILHINQNDKEAALKLATALASSIESTAIQRYCNNDMVNYILSDYAGKFEKYLIPFHTTVELTELKIDEIMLASILSNALDNALNATTTLPEEKRSAKLLLKTSNGKLLLSVRNSFQGQITFSDGLPISTKAGHGYGTQSIRYMTDRLGGNCQFTIEEDEFVLRVVV